MKQQYLNVMQVFFLLSCVVLLSSQRYASASIIDDLRNSINDRTAKIDALEKEIETYQKELDTVGKEKTTLQSAIKTLDISQKKISTDINITENRIEATTFQINTLEYDIAEKEEHIARSKDTLAKGLRAINESESESFIETLLAQKNISSFWEQIDELEQFHVTLQENLGTLQELKSQLENTRSEREAKRRSLINYTVNLSEQNRAIKVNKEAKGALLAVTQNKESNYKKLLDEKIAAREQFEKELYEFESELRITIDPNSIPETRKGVLAWPLDTVFITQYFGNTEFAKSGAYNGQGHNGIDFRASPGTQVKAVLSGTVIGTGDTDIYKGCYSYGKWVLIRHDNGLSSVYGHLSGINVTKEQEVVTGQTIGYSGSTGYSTGPHLHLSIFATQGVQLVRLGDIKKVTKCAGATIPVAPLNAYLNPLPYF